jgi:quinol monooxygenase YgiN
MLLILGSFRVDPARRDEVNAAMERMITETRAEPGCIQYAYAEDLLDPGLIHVTERWRDRDALAGHFSAPHLLEWRSDWRRLGIAERNLVLYESDDGEPI